MDALVWIDPPASGPHNMAIDLAMLEYANQQNVLVLRIYEWSQPTISLGYFQDASVVAADSVFSKLPFVRRLTGGGAILHDQEITYSIAVPNGLQTKGILASPNCNHDSFSGEKSSGNSKGAAEQLYRLTHLSVVRWLTSLGLSNVSIFEDAPISEGELNGGLEWNNVRESSTSPYRVKDRDHSFLCFHRRSGVDVVVSNNADSWEAGHRKILGSAQRRTKDGLLQHGSLIHHTSQHLPEIPGIAFPPSAEGIGFMNQTDQPSHFWKAGLEKVLRSAISKTSSIVFNRGQSSVVRDRATQIRLKRFQNDSWNFDRKRVEI